MPARHADEAAVDQRHPLPAADRAVGRQFLHRLPDRERRGVRRQRLAERAVEMPGNVLRPLLEEDAAAEAEDAAPEMIQADRDDRGRRLLDDVLEAALEGAEKADPRNGPFREDADEVPLGQRVARHAQRLQDRPGAATAVDRNHVRPAQDPAQDRDVEKPVPDDEPNPPRKRSGRDQDQRVEPAHVIADQERRPGARNVLAAMEVESPQRVGEHPERQANPAIVAKIDGDGEEEDGARRPDPPRQIDKARQMRLLGGCGVVRGVGGGGGILRRGLLPDESEAQEQDQEMNE